ncbi:MAG: hypothetical protein PHI02_03750 [Sulfurovaceae bacterium]|jgi:hypothetical protein|nr:hypothetical protein [Sulfurovaceae bacterium]
MDNCNKIKAHVFMEEKYERISLAYGGDKDIRSEIFNSIERVKKEEGLNPDVIERIDENNINHMTISIECSEDDNRVCGDFFTKLLKDLKIDHCESDI